MSGSLQNLNLKIFRVACRHKHAENLPTKSARMLTSLYKRLIFGAKNAFEDFQKIVETNITHDSKSVFNISDDIVTHATTQNEHLQQLRKVFDKLRENDLKLNFKICAFGKASINYMGHSLSSEGLFPEPEGEFYFAYFTFQPQIQVKFVVFWVLLFTTVNLFQISQLLLSH